MESTGLELSHGIEAVLVELLEQRSGRRLALRLGSVCTRA